MIFGTSAGCKKMHNVDIQVYDQTIQECDKVKYLGLILDPQLTFNEHVNYIRSKTVGIIKLLSRISNVIKHVTALFLFKSLIRPTFDYCDYVFDGLSQQSCSTLQKLQNMCLHNIQGANTLTRTLTVDHALDVDYLSTIVCQMLSW